MDLILRPPPDINSPGLAANDPTMLFPIAGAFLCISFYVNQQDELLGSYLQNSDSSKEKVPRLIGSIPLRYNDPDNGIVVFRSVTEVNREWREKAIVKMVRDINQRSNVFVGDIKIISSEAVPESMKAREERLEALGLVKGPKKPKVIKPKSTSVWVKKYVYESLFVKEVPNTRYLPLSFLINTINNSGTTVLYEGGIERLTIESDVDLLQVQDAENVALRIYGTCIDTNWRNLGSGTSKRIHFIYTQDNLRQADIAILDKSKESGGKKIDGVTVTSLAINLEESPITYATKSTPFLKQGLSLEVNQKYPNSLRLVHDQGSQMLFLAQAMTRVYPSTVNYIVGNKQVRITGEIPLSIRIDDVISRVTEISLTSDYEFPPPLLDWTSVKLKGVMFSTKELGIIYQDTSGSEWKIKSAEDGNIESKDITPSTKIDLLIFSKFMEKNNIEIPDKLPTKFENFSSSRYFQDVTFSLHEYNKNHMEYPRLETKSPEIKESLPKLNNIGTLIPYIFAVSFFLFFLFTWARPNLNLVWYLGQATAFIGLGFALFSVLSFFAIRFDIIPFLQKSHDDILFYSVMILLIIGSFSIISSLRFQKSVPSGCYMMAILLIIGMIFIRATPISKTSELTTEMVAWRAALIIMIFKAGLLFSWECLKLAAKSKQVGLPKPLTTGLQYTNPGSALIFAMILLIYPLYTLLLQADEPVCDAYKIKKEWLEKELSNTSSTKLRDQYEKELVDLKDNYSDCERIKNKATAFSGRAVGLIGVGLLFLYYMGLPVFSIMLQKIAPSKPINYNLADKQDSRVLLIYTVAKVFTALSLLIFSYIMLAPKFEFDSPSDQICNVARDNLEEFKERYGTDLDKVFYNTSFKLSQIRDKFDSLGCMSEQNKTILGIVLFLLGVWVVSIVTPPRFSSSFQTPSILDGLFFILFVSLTGFGFSWMFDKDNLRKALDVNSMKVINDVISLLKPPV